VILQADAICTTPHLSCEGVCATYNPSVAKAVILDDAGAMSLADVIIVWGQVFAATLKPLQYKHRPTPSQKQI